MAGRYDNPVPPRFPAPIDCSEIRSQIWKQPVHVSTVHHHIVLIHLSKIFSQSMSSQNAWFYRICLDFIYSKIKSKTTTSVQNNVNHQMHFKKIWKNIFQNPIQMFVQHVYRTYVYTGWNTKRETLHWTWQVYMRLILQLWLTQKNLKNLNSLVVCGNLLLKGTVVGKSGTVAIDVYFHFERAVCHWETYFLFCSLQQIE